MTLSFPRIEKGNRISIKMLHINDPHDFYVMPAHAASISQSVMDECASRAELAPPFDEKELARGKRVLAFDHVRKEWKRGLILKSNLTLTKIQIKYVDIGAIDEVPLTSLRVLEKEVARYPNLAIHCKLYWCQPLDGNWTDENIAAFKKFVGFAHYGMFMEIKEIDTSGMCSVDIQNQCNEGISMMMVYAYEACLGNPENEVSCVSNVLEEKLSYKHDSYKEGQTLEVLLSHIEDNGTFYVRKIQNMQKFMVLMRNMAAAYTNIRTTSLDKVNVDDCVACDYRNEFGTWSRGQVKQMLSGPIATEPAAMVDLVDSGISVCLSMSEMRCLKPQFCEENVFAIYCKLDPVLSNQMNVRSLRKMKNNTFTIKVTKAGDKFNAPHSVIINAK